MECVHHYCPSCRDELVFLSSNPPSLCPQCRAPLLVERVRLTPAKGTDNSTEDETNLLPTLKEIRDPLKRIEALLGQRQ